MIICYKTKQKLNTADKKVISKLNEYGIDGYLVRKKGEELKFHLRKPGMLSYFKVSIYSKWTLEECPEELEQLDRALTERVEQEDRAKQCGIIFRRIRKLCKATLRTVLDPYILDLLLDKPDTSDEVKNLICEYHRLFPSKATTYEMGGDYRYASSKYYWEQYIRWIEVRSVKLIYIPVYTED
ncbi:MAG: hypothetical protein IJ555_01125 [Ruminococcus sp.]|nr:hypothetical protein [Ruminococcus sp.]MBR2284689.1 hypothetical protein [Ruminococcus sp.]